MESDIIPDAVVVKLTPDERGRAVLALAKRLGHVGEDGVRELSTAETKLLHAVRMSDISGYTCVMTSSQAKQIGKALDDHAELADRFLLEAQPVRRTKTGGYAVVAAK